MIASAGATFGALAIAALVVLVIAKGGALVFYSVLVILAPGLGVGFFINAFLCRIVATIRYLPKGWFALVDNWQQLVWSQDIRCPPELLPGINQLEKFKNIRTNNLFSDRTGMDRSDWLLRILITPFLYFPALLYRLSLKSTFWFYWPLIFAHNRTATIDLSDKALLKTLCKTLVSTALVGISIALYLGLFKFDLPWLTDILKFLKLDKTAPALVDQFGEMSVLLLPTAANTVALYLLSNFWLPRAEDDRLGGWRRTLLVKLVALRWFFVCTGLLMGLILFWVDTAEPLPEILAPHLPFSNSAIGYTSITSISYINPK